MAAGLTCTFWGVRGSIPAPLDGPEYRRRVHEVLVLARQLWAENPKLTPTEVLEQVPPDAVTLVGGETTCIELRSGDDQLIIDMGTGARRLGYDMMVRSQARPIHILMTHTHWDHMQGWPFFIPGYLPTSELHFHSLLADLEHRFEGQQVEYFFPVEFQAMASKRSFHHHRSGESFTVGPFEILVQELPHPGGAAGFRVNAGGRSVVIAPDCEIPLGGDMGPLASFFQGTDTLVLDGHHSGEEARAGGTGGHGAPGPAAKLAAKAGVQRLVLTHHAPFRIEKEFRALEAEAKAAAPGLDVRLARVGDEFVI